MKRRWFGVAAIIIGFVVMLGAAGNCDMGGDFTSAAVNAVVGVAIMAAGVLYVRYIEAKY